MFNMDTVWRCPMLADRSMGVQHAKKMHHIAMEKRCTQAEAYITLF